MITDADAKKLVKEFKKIFATKEELSKEVQDLHTVMQKSFDELAALITESTTSILEKIDRYQEELRDHRTQIDNHETRIKKLERKNVS